MFIPKFTSNTSFRGSFPDVIFFETARATSKHFQNHEKPRCSKKAGIGALIGVIVWFFLGVVLGTVAVIVLPDIVGQYAAAALSFPL